MNEMRKDKRSVEAEANKILSNKSRQIASYERTPHKRLKICSGVQLNAFLIPSFPNFAAAVFIDNIAFISKRSCHSSKLFFSLPWLLCALLPQFASDIFHTFSLKWKKENSRCVAYLLPFADEKEKKKK